MPSTQISVYHLCRSLVHRAGSVTQLRHISTSIHCSTRQTIDLTGRGTESGFLWRTLSGIKGMSHFHKKILTHQHNWQNALASREHIILQFQEGTSLIKAFNLIWHEIWRSPPWPLPILLCIWTDGSKNGRRRGTNVACVTLDSSFVSVTHRVHRTGTRKGHRTLDFGAILW